MYGLRNKLLMVAVLILMLWLEKECIYIFECVIFLCTENCDIFKEFCNINTFKNRLFCEPLSLY